MSEEASDVDVVAEAVQSDRPEHVPEKFWDAESGQVKTDSVLESYTQLEKRFGAFTGAPEEYEFSLSQELSEQGIELSADDPLIEQFKEMAKESNMSAEMANKLVNMYVEGQYANSLGGEEAEQARIAEEMKQLGDKAEMRINNISRWADANLSEEVREGLLEATTTAKGVMAVERLIAMTRNAPMGNDDVTAPAGKSHDELRSMRFAKDDRGNLRMQTDPEYRKLVEAEYAKAFPADRHQIIVG